MGEASRTRVPRRSERSEVRRGPGRRPRIASRLSLVQRARALAFGVVPAGCATRAAESITVEEESISGTIGPFAARRARGGVDRRAETFAGQKAPLWRLRVRDGARPGERQVDRAKGRRAFSRHDGDRAVVFGQAVRAVLDKGPSGLLTLPEYAADESVMRFASPAKGTGHRGNSRAQMRGCAIHSSRPVHEDPGNFNEILACASIYIYLHSLTIPTRPHTGPSSSLPTTELSR